jgi:riboflavin kinase, archaea type
VAHSGKFVAPQPREVAADLVRQRDVNKLSLMTDRFVGRVRSGKGDASHWLSLFNAAYSRKVAMPVFPGSLNLALPESFDWFAHDIRRRTIWFDRTEYGGERDILLVPCVLTNLAAEPAWLWTPTTAARERPDPWVVEVIAGKNLRETYGLIDDSPVEVALLESPHVPAS